MQVSGKLLVLATFGVGLAMSVGAWWYNLQQSHLTAKFWGADAAQLIIGSEKVTLVTLDGAAPDLDLTGKPGLVHLRHSLTYDGNFHWNQSRQTTRDAAPAAWARELRFTRGERVLAVLFTDDFTELGKPATPDDPSAPVDVLPCPALGPVIVNYLTAIGASPEQGAAAPPPEAAR